MNQVITYQEIEREHPQVQTEISFTINENQQIKGRKKNLKTNTSTLIIGKKLSEDFIELIDFSEKNLEPSTFYGRKEPFSNVFMGNWNKTTLQDIRNLSEHVQIIPEEAYIPRYQPSIILKPYTKSIAEDELNLDVLELEENIGVDNRRVYYKIYSKELKKKPTE